MPGTVGPTTGPSSGTTLRGSLRTAVVWSALRAAVDALARDGDRSLAVVDVGGGTGGFAVPLAELGHQVTVVDPSPDSLAALERRAAEAGVSGSVRAVQGDATDLDAHVGTQSADVVVCHSVLEVVDDPAAAVAAVAGVLRPGGVLSVLAAGRAAAAVARALSGRFDDAAHVLIDSDGRLGASDPLARRFGDDELVALLGAAGLQVEIVHGVRVFSDLVAGALLDDPAAGASLLALEQAVAERPEFRTLATQLHVLARR